MGWNPHFDHARSNKFHQLSYHQHSIVGILMVPNVPKAGIGPERPLCESCASADFCRRHLVCTFLSLGRCCHFENALRQTLHLEHFNSNFYLRSDKLDCYHMWQASLFCYNPGNFFLRICNIACYVHYHMSLKAFCGYDRRSKKKIFKGPHDKNFQNLFEKIPLSIWFRISSWFSL